MIFLKKFLIILVLVLSFSNIVHAVELPVTSPFGWRVHPISGQWKFHSGVDLGYDYGSLIISLFDGEVVSSGNFSDGYGNQVLIYHRSIDAYTRYAHCSDIYVSAGAEVLAGNVMGAVGSTGYSTGPHLHLEYIIRDGDNYVYADPLILWQTN